MTIQRDAFAGATTPLARHASSQRSPFRTQLIISELGLVRLLPEWWGLWERAEWATPFQSPAWLLPWWQSFHPGDLFVVAIRRHDELVALAPLYREVGRSERRLLPIGISASDYLDVLIDPAFRDEAGARLVETVTRYAEEFWDSWHMEDLSHAAEARLLPVPTGFQAHLQPQSACPILDLAAMNPRPARRVAKAWARARRRGDVRVLAEDPGGSGRHLDILIHLHAKRWTERGEPGVLSDPSVQAFHRTATPHLHAAGLLRAYVLEIGGLPVGAYRGLAHRGRAYGYLSGFDPAYAFESPGTILLDHAIREAVHEGCCEFDFLRGQEPYKYAWGARDRWTSKRIISPVPHSTSEDRRSHRD